MTPISAEPPRQELQSAEISAPHGTGRPVHRVVSSAATRAGYATNWEVVRKVLLRCGVLSSLLYVVADVFAWTRYPGYSPISQIFSELLAEGAPTRSLLLILDAPYTPLVAAVGVGVWISSGGRRTVRITGAMLVLYAIFSWLGGTVFQMDVRGAEPTPRGSLHPLATAVMLAFMFLSLGFGAFLHAMRFRLYSIATILIIILFAGLTFMYVPQLAANQPTPLIGLLERVNIYAWMLWVAVLAISLCRVRGVAFRR